MSEPDLLTKDLLLNLARSEVVVVVEADFTNSARERLCVDRATDFARGLPGIGRELSRRVRMYADREPHVTPTCADRIRLLQLWLVVCSKDHENPTHARFSRP